nr:hypothetical protein [Blunervirus sp.]
MANLMSCFAMIYVYFTTVSSPHCEYPQHKVLFPKAFYKSDLYAFSPDLGAYDVNATGVVRDKSGFFFAPPFCVDSIRSVQRPMTEYLDEEDPRLPVYDQFGLCAFERLTTPDAQRVSTAIADVEYDQLPESTRDDLPVYQLHDEGHDVCYTWVHLPKVTIRFYRCHVHRVHRRFHVTSTSFATTALDVFSGVLPAMEHFLQSVIVLIFRTIAHIAYEAVSFTWGYVLPLYKDTLHFAETVVDSLVPYGFMEAVVFAFVTIRFGGIYAVAMCSLGTALVAVKLVHFQ